MICNTCILNNFCNLSCQKIIDPFLKNKNRFFKNQDFSNCLFCGDTLINLYCMN